MTDLTTDEFMAVFDRFATSPTSRKVFRWEGLQDYAVSDEDASLIAYRTGAPRPERSIRTDMWLRRIARSTLAGKDWSRVRYVQEPRTEYTDWELLAHAEAQVAGDRIFVVRELWFTLMPDYWLFTGEGAADNHAVLMHYDDAGAPTRFEYRDAPEELDPLIATRDALLRLAMPLNDYLARSREALGVH